MTWDDPWGRDPYDQGGRRRQPVEILPVLWRFRWTIAAAAVVAAGLAYGLSLLQPTQYTATAQMILSDPRNAGVLSESRIVIDPVRYVRTQAELAESTPVLTRVIELTGRDMSIDTLEGRVSTQASQTLDLITIVATDATAAGAKELADALGQAYQDQVRAEVQRNAAASVAELTDAKSILDVRVASLESQIAADPTNASLQAERDAAVAQTIALDSRINQITVDASLYGSGVQLFEPASLPTSRSQPTPTRNAALGLILGLMAGGAYAWWMGERRRVVTSRHDPAPILGVPLLGVIPDLESVGATTKAPTLSEPGSTGAEAYHFVASSLDHHIDDDSSSQVILITSPTPNDGKTVTAFNVAVAIARGGRRVLLVDADERARGLSRWQKLDDAKGLTDLGNGISVDDVATWTADKTGLPIRIIPAGTRLEIGPGFFRSAEFRKTMTQLRDAADVVVIDSPPILSVADALAVAGRTDGVVLVITQGASYQVLEDARDRLSVVGTPLLGYVFNRARSRGKRGGYGYGSGYGYGYGYGYGSNEQSPMTT
jgi:capsular exopolysaccharide synthesis family protein